MTGKHPQIEYIDVVEYIMYNVLVLAVHHCLFYTELVEGSF